MAGDGQHFINDNGSLTLTSGYLTQKPIPGSSAGDEAGRQSQRGESHMGEGDPGDHGAGKLRRTPAVQVARAYVASVEGSMSGSVLDVRKIS